MLSINEIVQHNTKGGGYLGDSPAFSFGSGAKGASITQSYIHNPGPGEYISKSSIGHQELSANATGPEFSFGSAARGESGKTNPRFISSLHSIENVGRTHQDGPKYNATHNAR